MSTSSLSQEISPGKSPTSARAVTLAQLAKHVGVSSAAASVVLNNTDSRIKVSEATRRRILEGARELNYQPNALARSLMKRQTNVIGFCSTLTHMLDPMYPFLGALLQGMLAGCRDNGKNLLMYSRVPDVNEDELCLEVLNGQLDGLVLFAHEASIFTRRLQESNLPVITVADTVSGFPCVSADDDLGGRLLARYTSKKGHQRVLYWAPSHSLSSSMEQRLESYLDEAALLGLSVEVFRERHPYELHLEQIMSSKNRPDVIAVYCDITASFIINSLNTLGIQVPRDVAVTGFDGVSGSFPTLTTIHAPWREAAQTAVLLLIQQCEGSAIPMQTKLPVELVVSETA